VNDGDISISAYDTAWVALVSRLDGGEGPEFPAAVQWIVNNQLPDGSWGDADLFSAYDRLINTLGCVVTLTKWSLEPEMCNKGIEKKLIWVPIYSRVCIVNQIWAPSIQLNDGRC